ncbi:MAG TPA: glycosyl hydrolase [Steroidobacteraceae bacterium]|nr:glycosyl hydrolase [Steroidobacteraceae bacterium]
MLCRRRGNTAAHALAAAILFALGCSGSPGAEGAADPLHQAFQDPPAEARPRVWWHWLSGNVDRRGITLDFEWMKRVGIAGAQMFDGDMGAPQIVDKRVTVLSREWQENLAFAAAEAERLGLEFGIAAAPGWSETGGPWVKPEWGMKKLVWSELRVSRGNRARIKLPPLPDQSGPFQTLSNVDYSGKVLPATPFARDIAVIAFPAPAADVELAAIAPRVSASSGALELARLHDGLLVDTVTLPAPTAESPIWIRYDFDRPRTMRALTMVGPFGGRFAEGPSGRIEASDDGKAWRSVRTLVGQAHNPAPQRTFAFPATSARSFRVLFERAEVSREPWPTKPGIPLAELALVPGARVNFFEDKAAFGVIADPDAARTPEAASDSIVSSATIQNLSSRLGPDGTLDWRPPSGGDWIVLRLGYSLTGKRNHPATPEGTGPEVDKLNAAHVRAHLDGYLQPIARTLGPLFGKRGLAYLLTDSWEAGTQNWTEDMAAEFQRHRGYSLEKFLPVLTGRIVDGSEQSDAFLWDFRRTIADLIAENHYGTITRFAKERGLGYYGEATGAAWPTVSDGMHSKSFTDIPMGEFWAMPFGGKPAAYHGVPADEFPADVIETASTAHVYGKPIVAAEALTSSLPHWTSTPWSLKWVADKYMAMGVNRLVIHTSPHQPGTSHKPGLTLGPFGQAFTRNETWAEMAGPWITYLARSSYLLQQGRPVADLLYFYGEGAPSGVPYREAGQPVDPVGYGFDYVNADALLRLAKVEDGRISFPGGATYRILVLPPGMERMTLPMIRKLEELVRDGAIVVGKKPAGSPSLSFDSEQVRTVADQLWGQADGLSLTVNTYGRGRVYWHPSIAAVLALEGVARDFEYSSAGSAMELRHAHRKIDNGHIYFVTNQSGVGGPVNASFAVRGLEPEIWHADSGRVEPASFRMHAASTVVSLELAPYEAVFVLFRRPTAAGARSVPAPRTRPLSTLTGEWIVRFPADSGAPAEIRAAEGSWTDSSDPGIRYFSGVATYERSLDAPQGWFKKGERIQLDLGCVGELAEVRVNGALVGTAWHPPYKVDLQNALRPGRNLLQIRVANLWFNRFVGDAQPGATQRAFTNAPAGGGFANLDGGIKASSPLRPSGLLGPVKLEAVAEAR